MKDKKVLPKGWNWIKFQTIINELKNGFACGQRDDNGIIQLRMNNLTTKGNITMNQYIRVPQEVVKDEYILREGDIVFNHTNSAELVGKSSVFHGYEEPVVFSNHFSRIRIIKEIADPDFVAFYIRILWQNKYFEERCDRWIGQAAFQPSKINDIDIPLLPLDEQRRIAAIINGQLKVVDKALQAAEEQLAAADRLSKALFYDLFMNSQKDGWSVNLLCDISENLDGKRIPITKSKRKGGTIPYYGASGVVDYIKDNIFDEPLLLVSEDGANLIMRKYPISFSIEGKSWVNNHAHVLRFNNSSTQKLVEFFLNHTDISEYVTGSAQPKLNQAKLNEIRIPLPNSIAEIDRMVGIIEQNQVTTTKIKHLLSDQLSSLNATPAAILRKAFNGKLQGGPTCPRNQ